MVPFIRRPALWLVLLVSAASVLVAASPSHAAPRVGTAAVPFDQLFIDMMVPHHQGATAMARIALVRAEHPQLKRLAQAIVAAQDTEIARMKAWRKAWYGSDRTPTTMAMLPGMSKGQMDMRMGNDTTALRTAKPFDRAFINAMTPHHLSAIAAAKLELARGMHPELKALALAIIEDQAREVGQMGAYLDLWYGSSTGSMPGMSH